MSSCTRKWKIQIYQSDIEWRLYEYYRENYTLFAHKPYESKRNDAVKNTYSFENLSVRSRQSKNILQSADLFFHCFSKSIYMYVCI